MGWSEMVAGERFLRSEVTGAALGDERLTRRLEKISAAALACPSGSFPEMTDGDAALEGTYRFFSNDRVTPEAVLAPHVRATTARVLATGDVVVAHDTTEFSFGPNARGDLDRVGRGQSYGFDAHISLAIVPGEQRIPLGVLALKHFNRPFGAPRLARGQNKKKADNVTHRWLEQVRRVREAVGPTAKLIHTMDREADDYATLAGMVTAHERFVVRQAIDRRIESRRQPKVRNVVDTAELLATREVVLSARPARKEKAHPSRHPPRASRLARLEIRATTLHVERPPSAGELGPDRLTLNLVKVHEPHPPPGCDPVCWWLWTNEPIETSQQVLAVVDAYRGRWAVEEYFKALKTGCAIEKRQLESQHALLNALAVFVPVAWRLLLLRNLARHAPDVSASLALTPLQIQALRGFMLLKLKTTLPALLSAADALVAIAKMGGHIANNGDPGWIVLGRGFDRLLDIELGLALAAAPATQRDPINP
jgi:Transposase DNA-binding